SIKARAGPRGWARISFNRMVQSVAGRADRAHHIDGVVGVQRFAQAADVNIDSPRFDIDVMAPDRIQQLLAREDPPGMRDQITKQAKLRGAEMDRPAPARHPM